MINFILAKQTAVRIPLSCAQEMAGDFILPVPIYTVIEYIIGTIFIAFICLDYCIVQHNLHAF